MSDRRSFIKGMSLLGLGTLLRPTAIFSFPVALSRERERVAAATVIAVVQFAISASKLFKGNSSSNGLLALQIKMLENISRQLDVIKESIDVVSGKVDEVIELVGQLPAEVSQEIKSNSIQGYIGQFQSYMDFYKRVEYNPKRFVEIEADIDQLRGNINRKVNQLMLYDNYLNLPLIAAAMYIEHNCMVFLKHSPEKISSVMKTYRDFFNKVLYGKGQANLTDKIAQIRKERKAFLDRAAVQSLYQGREYHWDYGWWYMRTGFYSYSLTADQQTDNDKISELVALGLIEPSERIQTVKSNIVTRNGDKGNRVIYNSMTPQGAMIGPQPVSGMPTVAALTAQIEGERTAIEGGIKLSTLRLYSAVSCSFSANRALNFCNQF
jgi:hypothetical protein